MSTEKNTAGIMPEKEIRLTLLTETDGRGRTYYTGRYDPADLKDLCLLLLTDDALKEVATLATAHILARNDHPEALLEHLRSFAEEMRGEIAGNQKENT